MAIQRVYTIPFNRVSISAVQDLFNIFATSGMAFELHRLELGAEGVAAPQELAVQIKRMTATVTNGSGGSAPTPSKSASGQPAATVTARVNDTSRASTSGATTVIASTTWQLLNGLLFEPQPEDRPQFTVSENCLIGLETAPSGATTCSGYATIAEIL